MPDPIDVRIEKLVYGGEGLGHHDGHAVFTPFVLPGELAFVEPLERRKKFIRGKTLRILESAADRTAAPCPHFGVCGGCNYQHISYDAQLRFKTEILRETLARLGHVRWEGDIATHASPAFGYRNRAQWKIADVASAPGSAEGKTRGIGYFEAGSQKLCPITECPIVSPLLATALAAFIRLVEANKVPATLREVEAFADADDAKLLLNLDYDGVDGSVEPFAQLLRAKMPAVETVLAHDRRKSAFELSGPGHISYSVGDHAYQVGHLSFFQVNRFVLPELAAIVIGDASGKLAVDLFAGVGFFTLPLAKRFQRVIGIESNAAAARDMEANLQGGEGQSTSFRQTEVEKFVARIHEVPDFVVLDPPRAGVPHAALMRLSALGPANIAYLSCDPATLARDLAILTGTAEKPGRYTISELHIVDIFPQTYHIEALVRLSRR